MDKKENSIDSLNGLEKILFYKMVGEAQQINQNGSACSYGESISFYNSMKDVAKIFDKHNMSLNIMDVFDFD